MPEPKCLITGCRFIDRAHLRHVWGDLHQSGSAVIFNAVLDGGEAAWSHDMAEVGEHEKTVSVHPVFPFFERRGVIVFDKYNASFNEQAKLYLGHARS